MAWSGSSQDRFIDLGSRMTIASLTPGISSGKLIGVVIARGDPRCVAIKKDPGQQRHVMSFTLRDSPEDFINITCWGDEKYIEEVAVQVHIDDVVEVEQYVVQSKPNDGTDERFRPTTPSLCHLSLSDKRSTIKLYCGPDLAEYKRLSHIPAKASNDYYTIGDVLSNGEHLQGEIISLQAAVRNVGAIRKIVTKTAKQMKCCEVKLFDETASNFILTLWNEEIISAAQTWIPKENVIFAADVRIAYDDFKKSMVATANSKTIVTVNPDTREARSLYMYAQTKELDDTNDPTVKNEKIDVESIQNVCTVEQVKAKDTLTPDGSNGYAVLYAYISKFNIDDGAPVSVVRCAKCHCRVDNDTLMCANGSCPQGALINDGNYGAKLETENQYNIAISLTDRTGTIAPCYLTPEAAQHMLESTVDDFIACQEGRKTALKWKFLLEKCKVYVKILQPSSGRPQFSVRVLGCTRADPKEALACL